MFDDQENEKDSAQKPGNPPEDIFAGVGDDDVAPPDNLPTATPAPQPPVQEEPASASPAPDPAPAPEMPTATPPASAPPVAPAPAMTPPAPKPAPKPVSVASSGALKTFMIVILAVAIIGTAAFLAYKMIIQAPQDGGAVDSVPTNGSIIEEEEGSQREEVSEEDAAKTRDSDGDGLTDYEEIYIYGTDAFNPDSDGDGLGDREEVKVYGTDPLNPDSDGDGFLDGEEVASGYNPNGPGQLIQVPGKE